MLHGPRSPRKEEAHDPLALLVFLYVVTARARLKDATTPFAEGPVTEVRPKRRPKRPEPSVEELRALMRQVLLFESGSVAPRVLNQFVRHALGCAEGLQDYLRQAAQARVREHDRRMKAWVRDRSEPRPFPLDFAGAWRNEFRRLIERVRAYVAEAGDTGERTRKGYFILRSADERGRPIFLTVHDQKNRVVGIYTGAQFNRKRANRRRRSESHRRAIDFRRSKARLTPR